RLQAKTADDFVYDTYYSFLHYFDRNPIILNFISKNLFPIRSAIYEGNQMTGIYFELEKDLKGMIKEGLFPATSNTRYLAWTMVGTAVEILTQMTIKKKINIQDCCDYMVKLFVGGAKNAV
ncbi:MAG: hypothetical protein KDK45_21940, partial [Leptospiraceae bacterium]|nr:hypothetical protein [Leptospiraceae bacterium]